MHLSREATEQEEVVCRICRLEAEPDNALFHPCKCSGTIKFVHQDCLDQWLRHSGHKYCEVCKHKFSFTPLYAPDAPRNLPWLELLRGVLSKGASSISTVSRVLLVAFVWLSIVPLATCWMWRLGFTRSSEEAMKIVKSRIHPLLLLADCIQGSLISSILIFLVLFVGYVWQQVQSFWQTRQIELRWERQAQLQRRPPQPLPVAPPLRLVDRIREQQQHMQQQQQAQQQEQQQGPDTLPVNQLPKDRQAVAHHSSTAGAAQAIPGADDARLLQPSPADSYPADQAQTQLQAAASSSEEASFPASFRNGLNVGASTAPERQVVHATELSEPSTQAGQRRQQQQQQQQRMESQSQQESWHTQLPVQGSSSELQSHQGQHAAASPCNASASAPATGHSPHAQQLPGASSSQAAHVPDGSASESSEAEDHPARDAEDRAGQAAVNAALQPAPAVPDAAPDVPNVPAEAAHAVGQEPMAFEDLIGLRGPVRLLFENAGTMILSAGMFIVGALWLPFTWGRVTIKAIAMLQAAWRLTVLPSAAVQLLLKTHQAGQEVLQASAPHTSPSGAGQNADTDATLITMHRLAQELEKRIAGPDLSDWLCLGIGYLSLLGLALSASWLVLSWKALCQWGQPRRLAARLSPYTRSALHAAWPKLVSVAGQVALMSKVMLVLLIELAVLPVVYGFWLDICTLPLLGGSLQSRLSLLQHAPVSWTMLHWVLGMACLMATATFLSTARSLLRPGALPWLKDPFDPEGEPLQQVLTSSMSLQLEREATSLATMGCLAVLLVHLPIKLASLLAPSLFPLAFHSLDSVTEIPADILLLHVCLPFTLAHLNLRQWARHALKWWLRRFGHALDVDLYLLGPPPHPTPTPPAQPPAQAQPPAADQPPPAQTQPSNVVQSAPEHSIEHPTDMVGPSGSDAHTFNVPLHNGQLVAAPQRDQSLSATASDATVIPPQRHVGSSTQHPSTAAESAAAAEASSRLGHSSLADSGWDDGTPGHRWSQAQRQSSGSGPLYVGSAALISGCRYQTAAEGTSEHQHLGRPTQMLREHMTPAQPIASADQSPGLQQGRAQRQGPGSQSSSSRQGLTASQQAPQAVTDHYNSSHPSNSDSGVHHHGSGATADKHHGQQPAWRSHQAAADQQEFHDVGEQRADRLQHAPHSQDQGAGEPFSQQDLWDGPDQSSPAQSARHEPRPAPALQLQAGAPSTENTGTEEEGQIAGAVGQVQGQQQQEPQQLPADGSADGLAANTQQADYEAGQLTGQLLALGLLLVLTLMLTNAAALSLPCLLGQVILKALGLPLRHDLYCALVGGYAIWGLALGAIRLVKLSRRAGDAALLSEAAACCAMVARLGLLGALGLVVVPLMAGLYLDMIMLPLRVRSSESPIIFFYQDWACGLLICKVCLKMVTTEGNMPPYFARWRHRIQEVQRIGLTQVPLNMALREVFWPIMKPLALLLAVPHAFSKGVVPYLMLSPEQMQAVYVYSFTFEYFALVTCFGSQYVAQGLQKLHNSIRDDRYLVGRQLNNFLSSHI